MTNYPAGRTLLATLLAAIGLNACSNWQRVGSPSGPTPEQQLLRTFDPAAMYTGLGRIVSAEGVNYVGNVSYLAGKGDSTLAVIGLSLSNHALGFQRSGNAYAAKYRLEYQFDRPGQVSVQISREETVRVGTFEETQRIDESLLLQQVIALAPGSYTLTIRLTDTQSRAVGLGKIATVVPSFVAGSVSAPVIIYGVNERTSRKDSAKMVMNPRGTVAYGGDTLRLYVEGVGYTKPTDVPFTIRDDRDSVILKQTLHMTGTQEIQPFQIVLAPEKAPLGRLDMVTGLDTTSHRTQAIVSYSQSWVVTNFTDLLDMLRYFGQDTRVNLMRKAKPEERATLWRDFLRATDPNLATPENEALEAYFARLAYANYRFRDEGVSGWRTDRGEVFILFGEPDEIIDRSLEPSYRYFAWSYTHYRMTLYFQDLSGFTRFRLTPESRNAMELAKLSIPRRGS